MGPLADVERRRHPGGGWRVKPRLGCPRLTSATALRFDQAPGSDVTDEPVDQQYKIERTTMSRHRPHHAFLLQRIIAWAGLAALVMTLSPLQPAAAAAMPTLTLDPNRGPCTTQVTARGEDF